MHHHAGRPGQQNKIKYLTNADQASDLRRSLGIPIRLLLFPPKYVPESRGKIHGVAAEDSPSRIRQSIDSSDWGSSPTQSRYRGSNVTESCYRGSNMTESCYRGSNVTESCYRGSNVTESRYRGSDVTESRYRSSNAAESRYRGSNVTESRYRGSNATESTLALTVANNISSHNP